MNLLTIEDIIPEGTFCSELTAHQIRAIQLIKKIGNRLASEHPEIADLYRRGENFHTYIKIAESYLDEVEQFPQVASRAVGYAVRKLLPQDELAEIRRQRRTKHLEDLFDGFDSEKFRAHCRNAAKQRHTLDTGVDTDAMVSARGRTPWSDDEKQHALVLSNSPDYQHKEGSGKGWPDYELIALALNIIYHGCSEIRYANSVSSFIRDTRRIN